MGFQSASLTDTDQDNLLVQGHSTSKDELDHFLDHLRMQKKETTTVPES